MSKKKLTKVKIELDSSSSDNENELTHYVGNRIQLMQEVFKIIKPKKLALMAPECIKEKSTHDLKSMLLEELLGISNKRLCRIFNGEKLDESSSTDSEIEKKIDNTDIISLDDITDDSELSLDDGNCMEINLSKREQMEIEKQKSKKKNKSLIKNVKIKKEKLKKPKKKLKVEKTEDEDPVMNVLNLLELQARARAIRSQLKIEKNTENNGTLITTNDDNVQVDNSEEKSPNSVIIVSPQNSPVVVNNSDSDVDKPCEETVQIKCEKQLTDDEIPKIVENVTQVTEEKSETVDDDILIVSEHQEICE